jgi:hypothetical protein
MVINIETSYNINDLVYVIYKDSLNNDFFCNELVWRVMTDKSWKENLVPFKIDNIIITQKLNNAKVEYEIDDYIYTEKELFRNLEAAQKECEVRNKLHII